MSSYPNRCQHLRTDGTHCGSPARRRNRFCCFHNRHQEERIRFTTDRRAKDARLRMQVMMGVCEPGLRTENRGLQD